MTKVTLHINFFESYYRFLEKHNIPALVSMRRDEVTFTMKADDEMKIRGLWNPVSK